MHALVYVTSEDWTRLVSANLTAPFFMMQAAISHLIARNGNVVNVISAAAFIGQAYEIGRAHVCTLVTNAHLVCRLLLEKKKVDTLHVNHSCIYIQLYILVYMTPTAH